MPSCIPRHVDKKALFILVSSAILFHDYFVVPKQKTKLIEMNYFKKIVAQINLTKTPFEILE